MLLKLNDKLLHFLACLAITLTAGELCAVTAGVTKEAADWMYKKNCRHSGRQRIKEIGIRLLILLKRIMLDTLLVALVISVDTAQVKEFPQKAEVEFKKNDLKENIIKSALNFHNSGKKDDKTWNWKIQDVVFKKD